MLMLQSEHWLMESVREERVVWLRRLPCPFASIPALVAANAAVIREIHTVHSSWGVIVDMRRAPGRNDSSFEQAMSGLRDAVEAHFARTVVLLATQIGMLQVNRLKRQDGANSFVTTDEASALAFARGA